MKPDARTEAKPQAADNSVALDAGRVLLGRRFDSRHEAVKAIGNVMVARGDVTPRYVEGMLRKEEEFDTCITEGIALPHGTSEVRGEVNRNAVVFLQMPEGADWGKGRRVYIAIGLAGRGDEPHLQMLASLAQTLMDNDAVERLRHTTEPEEVVAILRGVSGDTE